jgi:hypothetical protein
VRLHEFQTYLSQLLTVVTNIIAQKFEVNKAAKDSNVLLFKDTEHYYKHVHKSLLTLPIITALPLGSIAKYWPGTILLQPLFPNVS